MSTIAPALLTARYERQVVKAFRSRGAISGPTAKRLRDLGLKDNDHLRVLVTETVLRKAGPERYFLHEATWAARDHMSWRTVGLLAGATGVVILGAVIYLVAR